MRLFLIFVTICFASLAARASDKVLNFEPDSLTIEKHKTASVKVSLTKDNNQSICLNFTYGDENEEYSSTDVIKLLDHIQVGPLRNQTTKVLIHALKVGHLVIGAKSNDFDIPFSDIFRVDVIHSYFLNIIIQIVGWIYFFAWSISFYPQIFLNYKLKDVSGLSFDYIALNFLGHFCYSVFNVSFYWIDKVQSEYFFKHPRGVNPVFLNDVFFSLHAVTITAITGIQCLIYRKAGHKMSIVASVLFGIMVFVLVITGIISSLSIITVLDYIYIFSYIKLLITIMKYIPQAYINFKRKSTVGWSIVNVLLDFTGGSLSLLQMFFLAFNYNDWTSIFGSPTKLGLGLLSIFFDLIFIIQHYILYRPTENEYTPIS